MEEIKVGEYVRTEYGICKLENYRESGALYFDKLHENLWSGDFQGVLYPCDIEDTIIKHSPNIIDLIEVGDYVNGYEVDEFDDDEGNMYLGFPIYDDSLMDCIEEVRPLETVDIKSIVTHEQFNSIKYEVKE